LRFPRIRKFMQYLREYGLIMSIPLTLDISLYFVIVFLRKIFYRWTADKYSIKEALFWSKDIATYLRYSAILGQLSPIIRKSDRSVTILDVGPGGEGIARFLKYSRDYNKCEICLADINPDFLKKVRIASCVHIAGDILPFENNFFDIVISVAALEHISKEKRLVFLSELSRVCKNTILLYFVMDDPEKGFSGKAGDLRFNKWHIDHFGCENAWTAEHLANQYVTPAEIEKSLPDSYIIGTQNVNVWFNYMTYTRKLLTGFLTGILYILKWKNKNGNHPFYGCLVKWNKPNFV
jgi:SAM-dependent methyltransferase